MQLTVRKKWNWLATDELGNCELYIFKPALVAIGYYKTPGWSYDSDQSLVPSREGRPKQSMDILDLPKKLALYKRVSDNWVKQKIK